MNENETDEQRKARKKAAFERILANRVTVSPDFDEKKELAEYREEKYENEN